MQDARSEAPRLDPAMRSRLLAAAEGASASERYPIHINSINMCTACGGAQVALPFSLAEIIARLRAGYYHQREAAARDIQVR